MAERVKDESRYGMDLKDFPSGGKPFIGEIMIEGVAGIVVADDQIIGISLDNEEVWFLDYPQDHFSIGVGYKELLGEASVDVLVSKSKESATGLTYAALNVWGFTSH